MIRGEEQPVFKNFPNFVAGITTFSLEPLLAIKDLVGGLIMKLTWLGHASFLLEAAGGLCIITDPYTVGGGIAYGLITESAEIATVSHEHGDHNNAGSIAGLRATVKGEGRHEVLGVEFLGVPSFHDTEGGRHRGPNTIFCFNLDNLRFVHLGDLGHGLSEEQVEAIGKPDVLWTPVGGLYTIDADGADEVCRQLKPRLVIPIHYKTARCNYPLASVNEFLKKQPVTRLLQLSTIELTVDSLPSAPEVWVLDPRH